jgi:hypothetical protein
LKVQARVAELDALLGFSLPSPGKSAAIESVADKKKVANFVSVRVDFGLAYI